MIQDCINYDYHKKKGGVKTRLLNNMLDSVKDEFEKLVEKDDTLDAPTKMSITTLFQRGHAEMVRAIENYQKNSKDPNNLPENTITRTMVQKGYDLGVIQLVNEAFGCVSLCCRIEDNAFYFIDNPECITAEDYIKANSEDKIVDDIYNGLNDLRETDEDEYDYYCSVLKSLDKFRIWAKEA